MSSLSWIDPAELNRWLGRAGVGSSSRPAMQKTPTTMALGSPPGASAEPKAAPAEAVRSAFATSSFATSAFATSLSASPSGASLPEVTTPQASAAPAPLPASVPPADEEDWPDFSFPSAAGGPELLPEFLRQVVTRIGPSKAFVADCDGLVVAESQGASELAAIASTVMGLWERIGRDFAIAQRGIATFELEGAVLHVASAGEPPSHFFLGLAKKDGIPRALMEKLQLELGRVISRGQNDAR